MRSAHFSLALFGLCSLFSDPAHSQPSTKPSTDEGTYLGVLFRPIPEALRDHLADLPKKGGVIVTVVFPKSPAEKCQLKRHDLLLRYNDVPIRDCAHFAKLICDDQPGKTANLTLIRAGRPTLTKVALERGPVQIIPMVKTSSSGTNSEPRAVAKPGPPDRVTVKAVPMDGNRMKVTFEYYTGTGKLEQQVCSGTPKMIDKQILEKLPKDLQSTANSAIEHLRKLRFQEKR